MHNQVIVPGPLGDVSNNQERFDGLLKGKNGGGPGNEGGRKRDIVGCRFTNMRFMLPKEKQYTRQYSHVYLQRLRMLQGPLVEECKKSWGEDVKIVEKIIHLKVGGGSSVIVGTLFKQQDLKPSVLDEFKDEFSGGEIKESLDNFCSDDDTLILEDESGRCSLKGLEQDFVDSVVTGIIIAVKGTLSEAGDLQVEGFCFPGFGPCAPVEGGVVDTVEKTEIVGGHRYLAIASGLEIGAGYDPLNLQLFLDYVAGHVGSETDQELEAKIVRVLLAGNSVNTPKNQSSDDTADARSWKKEANKLTGPMKQLDMSLTEVAACVPVDLMPGGADPCNVTLPQQPLHKCLFPSAVRFEKTFRRVTNPLEYVLKKDITVLGHSGEPILDMLQYTRGLSAVDLMEQTLQWRHMAPTAPDTLPCYPLVSHDPFVIQNRPQIYFAGNQNSFDNRLVRTADGSFTRIISVPSFCKTGIVVLVDLDSECLSCSTLQFGDFEEEEVVQEEAMTDS
mmetsp:Transcript_5254/g.11653  ORF Transcript_5254/g.11653 Transcript_5254/m.11653 type:complete len:503 (+) Transcript_5254:5650-7158(+)